MIVEFPKELPGTDIADHSSVSSVTYVDAYDSLKYRPVTTDAAEVIRILKSVEDDAMRIRLRSDEYDVDDDSDDSSFDHEDLKAKLRDFMEDSDCDDDESVSLSSSGSSS